MTAAIELTSVDVQILEFVARFLRVSLLRCRDEIIPERNDTVLYRIGSLEKAGFLRLWTDASDGSRLAAITETGKTAYAEVIR